MRDPLQIRDFAPADTAAVNAVAVAAFVQFAEAYDDWPAMAAGLATMSDLAESGEIVVAAHEDRVVGAVAYIPPGAPKAAYFDLAWPIVRMLVVDPDARGLGAGRRLT